MRILCIDDDDILLLMLARLLERRGHVVTKAESGEQGLERLRADPAAQDLVLTDFNLPGMSGIEVAHAVRLIRPDLRVAVASGYLSQDLKAKAQAAGVIDLIFKPDTVGEYCDAVERLAAPPPV